MATSFQCITCEITGIFSLTIGEVRSVNWQPDYGTPAVVLTHRTPIAELRSSVVKNAICNAMSGIIRYTKNIISQTTYIRAFTSYIIKLVTGSASVRLTTTYCEKSDGIIGVSRSSSIMLPSNIVHRRGWWTGPLVWTVAFILHHLPRALCAAAVPSETTRRNLHLASWLTFNAAWRFCCIPRICGKLHDTTNCL